MRILILYSSKEEKTEHTLALLYKQLLEQQGHILLLENVMNYKTANDIFPALKNFSPEFGITINLAGTNLLTTGEDSLLTLLTCPFAHEILVPPYYLMPQLEMRFHFNHILYFHNHSDATFVERYFEDIPKIEILPFPNSTGVEPYRNHASSLDIMSEIQSLPAPFSTLCLHLIEKISGTSSGIFCEQVLEELTHNNINNLTWEEEKNIISLCYLSVEYVNSIQSSTSSGECTSPAALLQIFLQQANFPKAH